MFESETIRESPKLRSWSYFMQREEYEAPGALPTDELPLHDIFRSVHILLILRSHMTQILWLVILPVAL